MGSNECFLPFTGGTSQLQLPFPLKKDDEEECRRSLRLAFESVDGAVGRGKENGWFTSDVQCNTALWVFRLDVFGFWFWGRGKCFSKLYMGVIA